MVIAVCVFFLFLTGICLAWRIACRKREIPWPWWLAWVMENPYMLLVNPAGRIVHSLSLQPGMSLLDLGCGAGRITVPAAVRLRPGGQALGVDMQERMISRLHRRARRYGVQNIRTQRLRLNQDLLPGPEGRTGWDRVSLVTVLGEIPDRFGLLQRVHNILGPRGILVITEVIPDPCYLRPATVRRQAAAAGFAVVRLERRWLSWTLHLRRIREPAPQSHDL